MNHEEIFKSQFFWVFLGWCVVLAIFMTIFGPIPYRDFVWIGSAIGAGLLLYKSKKLDTYSAIGAVWFGPILLLTYATLYFDILGKIDNWFRT